ncbi:MAG: DNA repair protein RadA [Clostridiales bacterium]|nr:DNA repair protein RadA [Clostridiales bacterium]MDD6389927.1 DNA repair protein RadA [Bacillota bacterium]
MAKKNRTVYVCQECGYESPKWMGQCICGAWNTFVEEKVKDADVSDKRSRTMDRKRTQMQKLSDVRSGNETRMDTGIGELNRVLGGGLVRGSLTLISGEPGIGKSTLILQAAANISSAGGTVLYVSGEESEEQIRMRADRICKDIPDSLFILSETCIENVFECAQDLKPSFMIIDSVQTMYSEDIDSAPGSVSQIRMCGNELMRVGKVYDIPVFIVAHVTKQGELAGPKTVEHMVDCVLDFTGERNQDIRILRCYKNRFGTTSEIGAFEMGPSGLEEIENLSRTFLEDSESGTEGAVVTAVYEGSRPLLMEVQALSSAAGPGFARRSSVGVDLRRLNMIIAVLEKKAGLSLGNEDIYLNVVGGLKPEGTYIDLAVALAIYSTYRGIPSPDRTIVLGEIGLTGELRNVMNADKIVREAKRMGFRNVILPKKNAEKIGNVEGMILTGVRNISEALDFFRR